eukprot:Phypoly_transcript_20076.p1 GENE.Phypoly_transcript_20076~~Phypoly_transcript_20076.p1  ORF type:complete len:211 (+),score=19.61 Phypoly_transcript_20076:52-684(+)
MGSKVILLFVCSFLFFACCHASMPAKEMQKGDVVEYPESAYVPFVYPHYLQCDPIWANDSMNGTGPIDTICAQGCAMSSLSMALHGRGYFLDTYLPIYPGTLNAWLRNNNGYKCIDGDCDNLVLDAVNQLDPSRISFISEVEKPDINTMKTYVQKLNPVMIAHVRNNTHFVLITGYDTVNLNAFYINDPYYPTLLTYQYSDMSDLLLYNM